MRLGFVIYLLDMADPLKEIMLAGERVIKAQRDEAEARRLYEANPTQELLDRWNNCREATDLAFQEGRLLTRQLEAEGPPRAFELHQSDTEPGRYFLVDAQWKSPAGELFQHANGDWSPGSNRDLRFDSWEKAAAAENSPRTGTGSAGSS